jgi:hypothetical protein
MKKPVSAMIFLVLWAGTAVWNAHAFDRMNAIRDRLRPDVVALPRPEVARLTSLGFEAVEADLYFIGAVHYLGELKYIQVAYGQLYNYIDLVISLAPDFKSAYRFGGMAIPWHTGTKWVNIDGAIDVLSRGVKRFPDDWFMQTMLAYDYSAYRHEYKKAGDMLSEAARQPGAPAYLGPLAARMYASTGDLGGAYAIAEQMIESIQEPAAKAALEHRAAQIKAEMLLAEIQAGVARFRKREGRLPSNLDDLIAAGDLTRLPSEPLGGHYVYDPKTGQVRSTMMNQPLEVFDQDANKRNEHDESQKASP